MRDATSLYAHVSRDMSSLDDKPRFTGFMPADELTAHLIGSKGPIKTDRPLAFRMDATELRRRDDWPGEIGDFVISGSDILTSQAVRNLILPIGIAGLMFVPALLRHCNGELLQPFHFLHVWQSRDLADFDRSEHLLPFDAERDRSHRLVTIALDDAAVQALPVDQRDIVKLARVSPPAVLFSKALVDRLAAANLTRGARFDPLEAWFEGNQFL